MLNTLTLRNFKSVPQGSLPLSTINVLIGENGSGKSSLIQALAVIKQSLGSNPFQFSGALLDLGAFDDVRYSEAGRAGEIELGLIGSAPHSKSQAGQAQAVSFQHMWAASESGPTRIVASLEAPAITVRAEWNRLTGATVSPNRVEIDGLTFQLATNAAIGDEVRLAGQTFPTGVEERVVRNATELVSNFVTAARRAIERLFFVPAMRGIERQSFDLGERGVADLGSPEGSIRVGQSLATTIAYERVLEDRISTWMQRVTDRRVEARLLPPRRVALDAVTSKHRVNLTNEGFGTNQLSHVLGQLALLPNDAVLAIEEPEIHLHPAAQSRLVGVLAEAIRGANSQLLVTTHSEHILYALMALVAENALKPDEVFVHHVAYEAGATSIKRLALDSLGRIEGGIPGFFDTNVEEFRRYLLAAEKRG